MPAGTFRRLNGYPAASIPCYDLFFCPVQRVPSSCLSVSAADGRHLARSVVARVLSLANPADLASRGQVGQGGPAS